MNAIILNIYLYAPRNSGDLRRRVALHYYRNETFESNIFTARKNY